jgi:hypothetical protein
MHRRACHYPTDCAMLKICYGQDEVRARPIESGIYKERVPNHAQELVQIREKEFERISAEPANEPSK